MKKKIPIDLDKYYKNNLAPLVSRASYVLRITDWKDYPVPVLVVKERREVIDKKSDKKKTGSLKKATTRLLLFEIGFIYGESLRRCLPILKRIISTIRDKADVPLELQRYLTKEGLRKRVTLPLDEEAGAKIGLISKLQMRIDNLDRVELITRRIAHFSREEAAYWLARTTSFGNDYNRWAISGLKIMLGGHSDDPAIVKALERISDEGQ